MKEENEIIAEFMGHGRITSVTSANLVKDKLHYDKDWNLLMTVVQKVKELRDSMPNTSHNQVMFGHVLENYIYMDIRLLHGLIVDLIKWYSTQSTETK